MIEQGVGKFRAGFNQVLGVVQDQQGALGFKKAPDCGRVQFRTSSTQTDGLCYSLYCLSRTCQRAKLHPPHAIGPNVG